MESENAFGQILEKLTVIYQALTESGENQYSAILTQLKECALMFGPLITEETENPENGPSAAQIMEQIADLIRIVQGRADGRKKRSGEELQAPLKRAKPDDKATKIVRATFERPKVKNLAEIIGMVEIKTVLKELVILPQRQPHLFEGLLGSANTVLFYGPPGTGKTKMAHAIAGEASCPLHCISTGDVLSHFVGQTEKNIKALFRYMRENYDHSILFIDEVDGLCRKRNDNEQEYTRRIKTELMCQISTMEGTNVFLICATNCPWDLDTAILRRLERRIYFPLLTRRERQSFIQALCEDIPFRESDFEAILDKTDGYSGSDLSQLVQSARRLPLRKLQDTKVWKRGADNQIEPATCEDDFSDNIIVSHLEDLPSKSVRARKVDVQDLLAAANETLPTVPAGDIARYEHFKSGK